MRLVIPSLSRDLGIVPPAGRGQKFSPLGKRPAGALDWRLRLAGEMAEWPIAPVLKTGSRASGTGVRIPLSPPFFCAPISGDDSPQTRELNVQDGVRFRAERAKDFCGGEVRGDILRQDRDKRGLGIGDARKGSVLGGIRAGRACGRAAARHGDRGGQPFRTALRTASVGRRGRLRRSAGLRQIPTLRSPQALLAARDLATPALAGGHWRNYLSPKH